MKFNLFFLANCVLLFSCQQAAESPKVEAPSTVDAEQVKMDIKAFMEKYDQAVKSFDLTALDPMFAEKSLIMGTDPGELWDKAAFMAEMERMSKIEDFELNYTVDTEKIHLAEDGQSALVVRQSVVSLISPHIPVRWVFQVIRSGDSWIIDYSNVGLIPKNEDLPKINAAFGE